MSGYGTCITERQRQLKEGIPLYVADYIIKFRMSPTVSEVAGHFGASKATVQRCLEQMDAEGTLPYRGRIGIPASVTLTAGESRPEKGMDGGLTGKEGAAGGCD